MLRRLYDAVMGSPLVYDRLRPRLLAPRRNLAALTVLALVGLAAWWPTSHQPWNNTDAPNLWAIARGIDQAPWPGKLRAALHAGDFCGPGYAGAFNPVFFLLFWICSAVVGMDIGPHRVLRLVTLLALAVWVYAATRRITDRPTLALLAGIGFLLYPSQIENYQFMATADPTQALMLALMTTCLWRWAAPQGRAGWLGASWMFLAAAVFTKPTALCVLLPLVALAVWGRTRPQPERARLTRGSLATGAASGLVFAALVWLMPEVQPGNYYGRYDVNPAWLLQSALELGASLWHDAALLAPLGLLGLAFGRAAPWREHTPGLLLVLGWTLGAIAILLPWRSPSTRHTLGFTPGLAVVIACGLARLDTRLAHARPLRMALAAVGGGSALWMVAAFTWSMHEMARREDAGDLPLQVAVSTLASRAAPGDAIVHVCDGRERTEWGKYLERHLTTFGGRPDLALTILPWPTPPSTPLWPGKGTVWVVFTPGEDSPSPAEVSARFGIELTPVLDVTGSAVLDRVPDPRYVLSRLVRRAPLLPPGWTRVSRWQILSGRASIP